MDVTYGQVCEHHVYSQQSESFGDRRSWDMHSPCGTHVVAKLYQKLIRFPSTPSVSKRKV